MVWIFDFFLSFRIVIAATKLLQESWNSGIFKFSYWDFFSNPRKLEIENAKIQFSNYFSCLSNKHLPKNID